MLCIVFMWGGGGGDLYVYGHILCIGLMSTVFGMGRKEVVFMVHECNMFFSSDSTFTHKNIANSIAEEGKLSNGTFMVYFKCCVCLKFLVCYLPWLGYDV